MKRDRRESTPEAQLRSYIDKLDPKNQKLIRSVRAAVRKRFPSANELAYDYSHALVIGYSPTDRGIDAVVAIRASATGLSLYFSQGPQLPDPKRLLRGSGKQVRFIQVESGEGSIAIRGEGQSHHHVGWCEEAATPEAVEVTRWFVGARLTAY